MFSWGRSRSVDDVERYRRGYPGKKDDPEANENLLFYRNELKSKPKGDYVEEIHKKWFGEYRLLERHHGFIQWLFPIREKGMNWESQPLQKFEAKGIREDPKAMKRFVKSYRLMLDFYGMILIDQRTGEVARNTKNYEVQYENLEESSHNWLRVTRILKSLGEMGLEHYKKPLLEHIIREMWRDHLRACLRSLKDYWIPVVKSAEERRSLLAGLKSPPKTETLAENGQGENGNVEGKADRDTKNQGQTQSVNGKGIENPKTVLVEFLRGLLKNPGDESYRALKLDEQDEDTQSALRNCGFVDDGDALRLPIGDKADEGVRLLLAKLDPADKAERTEAREEVAVESKRPTK
mmetsp:Transcript_13301/g.26029  ORF Transcript_13301/g.26029 Transcript_13301/m.26029 type:complete len:350 (-) Transcript_13301:124-1173(-)